ncbi:MAG: hypothetical protein M1831_001624 [Alyxoria varia]|nr:MAG: hypothetical protein M1831_001624 [Alyxoria varia]
MDHKMERMMQSMLLDIPNVDRLMLPTNPLAPSMNKSMQPVNKKMQPASQLQTSNASPSPATPERTPQQKQSASAIETYLLACRTGEVSQISQSYYKIVDSTQGRLQRAMLAAGLNECITQGHLDGLRFLLEKEPDVDGDAARVPVDCATISCIKSSHAFESVLELLIDHGYNMHRSYSYDKRGMILLEEICDDDDRLKWCLDHGAEPERLPHFLDKVVEHGGSISTFQSLQSRGASYCHPLDCAIEVFGRRYNEMLGLPNQSNPNVNPSPGLRSMPETKRIELQDSKERAMAMIKFLVEDIGIDINSCRKPVVEHPTSLGHAIMGTPLHFAIKIGPGAHQLITYLTAHGADPSRKDCCGKSVFERAPAWSPRFLQLFGERPED